MPWQRHNDGQSDHFDMPFEHAPSGATLDVSDGLASSGLVVISSVWENPDTHEKLPCMVYRFTKPDGSGFYPPMVLVMPPVDMAKVPDYTKKAVDAAIRASFE